jgi:hypothetical protein
MGPYSLHTQTKIIGRINMIDQSKKDKEAIQKELEPRVIESINKLLASDDLKLKIRGVELYYKFFGGIETNSQKPVIDPFVQKILGAKLDELLEEEEIVEIDKEQ